MYQKERMESIMSLLHKHGYLTVKYLVEELGYSTATVNRDLNRLEQMHRVRRTYGGVEPLEAQGIPLLFRYAKSKPSKKRIAKVAATLVEDGDVIFIDCSTTTQYMGEYLLDKKGIRVITANLALAILLSEHGITVTVLGGTVTEPPFMLSGDISVENAERYYADKCFFSVGSLLLEGADASLADSAYRLFHKTLLRNSKKSFLLLDKNKVGKKAKIKLCSIDAVHALISDYPFEEDFKSAHPKTEFLYVESFGNS